MTREVQFRFNKACVRCSPSCMSPNVTSHYAVTNIFCLRCYCRHHRRRRCIWRRLRDDFFFIHSPRSLCLIFVNLSFGYVWLAENKRAITGHVSSIHMARGTPKHFVCGLRVEGGSRRRQKNANEDGIRSALGRINKKLCQPANLVFYCSSLSQCIRIRGWGIILPFRWTRTKRRRFISVHSKRIRVVGLSFQRKICFNIWYGCPPFAVCTVHDGTWGRYSIHTTHLNERARDSLCFAILWAFLAFFLVTSKWAPIF